MKKNAPNPKINPIIDGVAPTPLRKSGKVKDSAIPKPVPMNNNVIVNAPIFHETSLNENTLRREGRFFFTEEGCISFIPRAKRNTVPKSMITKKKVKKNPTASKINPEEIIPK